MPSIRGFFYYIFHPQELRSMLQWSIWHEPVHQRDEDSEAMSLRICFNLLDLTSRSFSAVIKELNPELLVPVCLFYLILRGLDTIEDDMTIPLEKKDPLLRKFHTILEEDGWTFNESGPDEKDRELLVKFHYVITEFKKVKPEYKVIIIDITEKMGNGMADYAHLTDFINTTKDYETYCHYVAGLVGEGLTRLFVEAGVANSALLERADLHESMGQFLQQTNIIRDIREDRDDNRRFWPREIWTKHVDDFEDLFKPENREAALRCSSEMILNAINRADDCLFYLAGLRDQSVFNFCAIPQSMAIATLELCFRNPTLFARNIKITKGEACRLMIESSQNLQILYGAFRTYARKIHKKNDPRDPNFLKISIACGRIEQFIESVFPTQDPKAIVRAAGAPVGPVNPAEEAARKAREKEERRDMIYLFGSVFMVIMFIAWLMIWIGNFMGARFDLVLKNLWEGVRSGDLSKVSKSGAIHGEL